MAADFSQDEITQGNYIAFYTILPDITNESVWSRLMAQLPPWFGNDQHFSDSTFNIHNKNPGTILNCVLWAFNCTAGNISTNYIDLVQFYGNYAQYQYILAQMRLGPFIDDFMTDVQQLDLFSKDFFGNSLPRYPNENNESYKGRIYSNLLNVRATRIGLTDVVFNMTGFFPRAFEPWNLFDGMFYGYDDTGTIPISHCAYGTGYYGSGSYPYQGYLDVTLPSNQGMGNYPGFQLPPSPIAPPPWPPYPERSFGAYNSEGVDTPLYWAVYGSATLVKSIVTEAQVLQAINTTKTFGTRIWVSFTYDTSI